MAQPLALDNPTADANGKRGDPEWVPIAQAERLETLGAQLPDAPRIPARLHLLRAQQRSACDAERKRVISRLASGPRGSVYDPTALPPDRARPHPCSPQCTTIVRPALSEAAARVTTYYRTFESCVGLRYHVIAVDRTDRGIAVPMKHDQWEASEGYGLALESS